MTGAAVAAFGLDARAAADARFGRAFRHLRKGPIPTLLDIVSSTLLGDMAPACSLPICHMPGKREREREREKSDIHVPGNAHRYSMGHEMLMLGVTGKIRHGMLRAMRPLCFLPH